MSVVETRGWLVWGGVGVCFGATARGGMGWGETIGLWQTFWLIFGRL